MLDTPSLFDTIAQDDSQRRTASRQALALAHTRVDRHLGAFLRGAVTMEEFEARLAAVQDELSSYVAQASDEVGHEHPEYIAKTLVDHYAAERKWQPRMEAATKQGDLLGDIGNMAKGDLGISDPQQAPSGVGGAGQGAANGAASAAGVDPSAIHSELSQVAGGGGVPGQWNPQQHTQENYNQVAQNLNIDPSQVQQGLNTFYQNQGATPQQSQEKAQAFSPAQQGMMTGDTGGAMYGNPQPGEPVANPTDPSQMLTPTTASRREALGDPTGLGNSTGQMLQGQGAGGGMGGAPLPGGNPDPSMMVPGGNPDPSMLAGDPTSQQGAQNTQSLQQGGDWGPSQMGTYPGAAQGAGGAAGGSPWGTSSPAGAGIAQGVGDAAQLLQNAGAGMSQGLGTGDPALEQAVGQQAQSQQGGQGQAQGQQAQQANPIQQGMQDANKMMTDLGSNPSALPGDFANTIGQGAKNFGQLVGISSHQGLTSGHILAEAQNPADQDDDASRQVSCPECGGDGKSANGDKCPKCKGKGTVANFGDSVLDHVASQRLGESGNTDLGKPSPKMDKRKWTPQNVGNPDPGSTQHPNRTKDILSPIKAENRVETDHDLSEIGEQTTEHQKLPAADSSGFSTKQVPSIPSGAGGTWSGNSGQAKPVG